LVVMVSATGAMVRVRLTCLVRAGEDESVTVKVSGAALAEAVGVPVMAPEEPVKERPVGRVPLVRDQVRGCVPPVAARVVE